MNLIIIRSQNSSLNYHAAVSSFCMLTNVSKTICTDGFKFKPGFV